MSVSLQGVREGGGLATRAGWHTFAGNFLEAGRIFFESSSPLRIQHRCREVEQDREVGLHRFRRHGIPEANVDLQVDPRLSEPGLAVQADPFVLLTLSDSAAAHMNQIAPYVLAGTAFSG